MKLHRIIPENGELFIAPGAALMNDECRDITVGELTKKSVRLLVYQWKQPIVWIRYLEMKRN